MESPHSLVEQPQIHVRRWTLVQSLDVWTSGRSPLCWGLRTKSNFRKLRPLLLNRSPWNLLQQHDSHCISSAASTFKQDTCHHQQSESLQARFLGSDVISGGCPPHDIHIASRPSSQLHSELVMLCLLVLCTCAMEVRLSSCWQHGMHAAYAGIMVGAAASSCLLCTCSW